MAKDFAKRFYNSKQWQECRNSYVASIFGLCEQCNAVGVIVHHKITITPENIKDTDVLLNWDNLEYLCVSCHNKAHGSSEVIREGLIFSTNGDVVLA